MYVNTRPKLVMFIVLPNVTLQLFFFYIRLYQIWKESEEQFCAPPFSHLSLKHFCSKRTLYKGFFPDIIFTNEPPSVRVV